MYNVHFSYVLPDAEGRTPHGYYETQYGDTTVENVGEIPEKFIQASLSLQPHVRRGMILTARKEDGYLFGFMKILSPKTFSVAMMVQDVTDEVDEKNLGVPSVLRIKALNTTMKTWVARKRYEIDDKYSEELTWDRLWAGRMPFAYRIYWADLLGVDAERVFSMITNALQMLYRENESYQDYIKDIVWEVDPDKILKIMSLFVTHRLSSAGWQTQEIARLFAWLKMDIDDQSSFSNKLKNFIRKIDDLSTSNDVIKKVIPIDDRIQSYVPVTLLYFCLNTMKYKGKP